MGKDGLKFEPLFTLLFSVVAIGIIYITIKEIAEDSYNIDYQTILFAFPAVFFGGLFLPMGFKLLAGTPAVLFTEKQLINNIFGVSVNWDNIEYIAIKPGSRSSSLNVMLKNTDELYKGIGNPIKRVFLKAVFSLSTSDFPISLAFVEGDNDTILATVQGYWSRARGEF